MILAVTRLLIMMTMLMMMMMMIELDGFTNNMLVGDQRGGGNDVEEIGFGTGRPSHDLEGNFSMISQPNSDSRLIGHICI